MRAFVRTEAAKTSKYVGVFWYQQSQKWRASISVNKKKHYGGTFKSETSAARMVNQMCENLGIPLKNPSFSTSMQPSEVIAWKSCICLSIVTVCQATFFQSGLGHSFHPNNNLYKINMALKIWNPRFVEIHWTFLKRNDFLFCEKGDIHSIGQIKLLTWLLYWNSRKKVRIQFEGGYSSLRSAGVVLVRLRVRFAGAGAVGVRM